MPYILHVSLSVFASSVGIVFNIYILFVLLWHRRLQSAHHVLLLHLAAVDIAFCLVVLAYNTALGALDTGNSPSNWIIVYPTLSPSAIVCGGHGFVWTLLPVVLVWTLCGLSCDRYASVSQPLRYSRIVNKRRAFVFVAACWFLGGCLAVPPLLGVCPYTFLDARWACVASCSLSLGEMIYLFAYIGLAITIPTVLILVCNIHMTLIARYHRHRIIAAIYEVTLKAQATVTHQRNPCEISRFKGRSAVLTILLHVGSLVVFIVPYFVVLLGEAVVGCVVSAPCVSLTTVLLTCSPPVNAYVYGVKSRPLRQRFKRLLRRQLDKQKATREVERRLSLVSNRTRRSSFLGRRLSVTFASLTSSERSSWFDFRQWSRRQSEILCPERKTPEGRENWVHRSNSEVNKSSRVTRTPSDRTTNDSVHKDVVSRTCVTVS